MNELISDDFGVELSSDELSFDAAAFLAAVRDMEMSGVELPAIWE